MIYNKYKCIHIHIPKCAGTSIILALFNKKIIKWSSYRKIWKQHATAKETKEYYATEEQWNNYFKFAFVRNPFDKIVSSYNWLCRNLKACNFRDKLLFDDFVYRRGYFKEILDKNFIHKSNNKYHHLRPCYEYLFDNNNILMIDYIGRYENLKDNWNFICNKLKIKIKIPHVHKQSRDNKNYREYYNKKTKDFVYENYKKDLKIFKYKF